jgi:hypothetical protein
MYATTFDGTTDHVIASSSAMCKTTPYTIPSLSMPIAKTNMC